MSTDISKCKQMLINVSLLTNVSKYQQMLNDGNKFKKNSLSLSINQSMLTNVSKYWQMLTNVNRYYLMVTNVNRFQQISLILLPYLIQ